MSSLQPKDIKKGSWSKMLHSPAIILKDGKEYQLNQKDNKKMNIDKAFNLVMFRRLVKDGTILAVFPNERCKGDRTWSSLLNSKKPLPYFITGFSEFKKFHALTRKEVRDQSLPTELDDPEIVALTKKLLTRGNLLIPQSILCKDLHDNHLIDTDTVI